MTNILIFQGVGVTIGSNSPLFDLILTKFGDCYIPQIQLRVLISVCEKLRKIVRLFSDEESLIKCLRENGLRKSLIKV